MRWLRQRSLRSLQEALRKLSHHNAKVRKAALQNLPALIKHTLHRCSTSLAALFEGSVPCLHDDDREVRAAFLSFWHDCVRQTVPQDMMFPFIPLIMAHVRSACSHLNTSLRLDALKFLRVLISHCPSAVMQRHASSLLQLFADILSRVCLSFGSSRSAS